jgi:hypothetical protein
MSCTSNWDSRSITGYRKKSVVPGAGILPDTGILPLNPVDAIQLNPVDAIQGNEALTIQESIALWARLDELRYTEQPPPERVADYIVRDAQEQQRPLPERDRPLPSEPRDDYQYAYDGRIEQLASAAAGAGY